MRTARRVTAVRIDDEDLVERHVSVIMASVDPIDAPYMPIDDSEVENAPRPIAMGRTSYLHLGSERGGRMAAVLYRYSLAGTCKHHDIDPFAWL
jgi:hypothetical protein